MSNQTDKGTDVLELADLGDAVEETKQCAPDPAIFPDSWFGWGAVAWTPGGGCPW